MSASNERDRSESGRYFAILGLSALAAGGIWIAFHYEYANLLQTEAVMGYVDPTVQMVVDLGYVVLIGGTLAFGGLAVWSATRLFRMWTRGRSGTR